jgi:hypothetical protein
MKLREISLSDDFHSKTENIFEMGTKNMVTVFTLHNIVCWNFNITSLYQVD